MHLAGKPLDEPFDSRDTTLRGIQLTSHKNGFFQKFEFSAAWLPRTSEANLGLTELRTFVTVAVPLPTRDYPLLISPGLNITTLAGPLKPDLPPQLYGTYLELMWLPKLSERWLGILSVTPGVYSDFDDTTDDALRVKARALARYDWIPGRLQLMFGVLYLDRYDVNWLPAGGIIWTPNDAARYELVFPRPKLAHCLSRTREHEDWLYFAGEFGGDQYEMSYPNGTADTMILRDWRLYLGIERKRDGGAGARLEIGYVFSRSIQFQSTPVDYNTGDTIILRAVFDY